MIWLALASAAIWTYLLGFHGRFWQAGPELAPAVPRAMLEAVIVVPARDEAATIAGCLSSLLAQDYPGAFSVTLVDDHSDDGTADAAVAAAAAAVQEIFRLAAYDRNRVPCESW